jgi:hypothetical protein
LCNEKYRATEQLLKGILLEENTTNIQIQVVLVDAEIKLLKLNRGIKG